MSRRANALAQHDGFSLVELSIVLIKKFCHSVARVFAKAKTVNPESCCNQILCSSVARHRMTSGFSLVELSIVLVILGLLTGGILTGQNLIRVAELRQTMTKAEEFRLAYYQFRDKYFAVPGDMANATSFWTCTVVATDYGGFNPNCDGDGNGHINSWPTPGNAWEHVIAWEHLHLSGMINIIRDPTYGMYQFQGDKIFWLIAAIETPIGMDTHIDHIRLSNTAAAGALHAEDVWQIDTKMDDGMATTGKVRAYRDVGNGALCIGLDLDYLSAIDFSDKGSKTCIVRFIL